jgi:hypothetical protein
LLLHECEYPSSACVRTAQPYAARTVVSAVYSEMLCRWEQRLLSV